MISRTIYRITHQPHPQRGRTHRFSKFEAQCERPVGYTAIAKTSLYEHDEKDTGGEERSEKVRYEVVGSVKGVEKVEDCGEAEPDENGAGSDELEDPDGF